MTPDEWGRVTLRYLSMSVVVKEDQMHQHVDEKEKPQLKPHVFRLSHSN